MKLYRLLIISLFALLLIQGSAFDLARAQGPGAHHYYFPAMFKGEPIRLDDFSTLDPVWTVLNMKSSDSDTFFEKRDGVFYCELRDNSDRWIAHPGWRPLGDFKLEVDARFDRPDDPNRDTPPAQTRSGLGVLFGGSDDWSEGYAFMLGYFGRQHQWALLRFDGRKADGEYKTAKLINYGGAPPFVKGFAGWNHLEIVRIRDRIYLYCNGQRMPMPAPYYTYVQDGKYGTRRLVGVTTSTWEWNFDKIEFDNFELTPLSMPY